jgi:hypothetical protein
VQVHRALVVTAPNVLGIMLAAGRYEIRLGSPMKPPQL